MPQNKLIEQDYKAFVKQFGYEPARLTTSIDELHARVNALPESQREKARAELQSLLDQFDPDVLHKAEQTLDPSGYGEFLAEVLATPSIQKVTTKTVFCGEFPTGEFNASARRCQNGFLLLLNRGLRHLLYQISLAATYHIKSATDLESAIVPPHSREWAELSAYAIGVCLNYSRGKSHFDWQGSSRSPQGNFASSGFSSSMRTFVVAHEVAHVELGHLNSGQSTHVRTPIGDVEFISKSYKQEFEADQLAQQVLFEDARKNKSVGVVCGGVTFLKVDEIMELVRTRILQYPSVGSPSHPPPPARITALLDYVQRYGVDVEYDWCRKALAVFEQINDIISKSNVSFKDGAFEVSFEQ